MNLLILVTPIIFIIASGFMISRFQLLPKNTNEIFTRFVFLIAMPCQLFLDFAKTPVQSILNWNYMLAFALSTLIIGSLVFFISIFHQKESIAESALNVMGTAQVNTAYFAIPLFILVFNNPTPVIPILIFQVIILTTILLILIEYDVKKNDNNRYINVIKNTIFIPFKNPIILSSILGFITSFAQIPIPDVIAKSLNLFGVTAAPLALLSLGQSLYYDVKKIEKNDLKALIILTLTKLIIFPLLAYIIGKYVFSLSHFWLSSLVIMAAMPAPKNMYIFAVQYKLNTKKSAAIVSLTTLLSFISLNILLFL